MAQDVDYKPFLNIPLAADQQQLVVQVVIAAAQQEQQLIELLAHLPQAVQIIQQEGSTYTWHCAGNQGLHQACSRRFRKRSVASCKLSPPLLSASLLLSLARAAALPNREGEGRR